jgi:ribonucleoside-diphosphate reductase alpha chain
MAKDFGEPALLKGYGMRHSHTMAIAPTTSSSFILGQVSQSIEPLRSNYYVKNLAKTRYTFFNPNLEKLLESKGQNTPEVRRSILEHDGSVQHLTNILNDNERDVFKTFKEISQMEIITQAAQRQQYIDQGQSLNLLIDPKTEPKDINKLHIEAWKLGCRCLYYQHSVNASQEAIRNMTTCSSCEG